MPGLGAAVQGIDPGVVGIQQGEASEEGLPALGGDEEDGGGGGRGDLSDGEF